MNIKVSLYNHIIITDMNSTATIAKNDLNDILKNFIKSTEEDAINVAWQVIKMGADPNTKADDGETILFTATSTSHLSTINQFVSAGCDVKVKNNADKSAISIPLSKGELSKVKWFLEHGSDATELNKAPAKLVEGSLFGNRFYEEDLVELVKMHMKHGLKLTDRDADGQTLADAIKMLNEEATSFGKYVLAETEKEEQVTTLKQYQDVMNYLREHRLEDETNDYKANVLVLHMLMQYNKVPVTTVDQEGNIVFCYLKTVDYVEEFVQVTGEAVLQWSNDQTKKNLVDIAIEYGNDKLLRWYLQHMVGHNNQPEVVKILNENNLELTPEELADFEECVPNLYVLINLVHKYIDQFVVSSDDSAVILENYKKHLQLNYRLSTKNKNVPQNLIEAFCENMNNRIMQNKILTKVLFHFQKMDNIQHQRLFLGLFTPK